MQNTDWTIENELLNYIHLDLEDCPCPDNFLEELFGVSLKGLKKLTVCQLMEISEKINIIIA